MPQNEIRDEYRFTARFYDYIPLYRDRKDVDFYLEMVRETGGPVLELGCGTGRILLPVARSGLSITGLDVSEEMLAVCRENLLREPAEVREKIELICGDMCGFDLGRQFSLVTMPFRSFQHVLSVEDQVSCLECVHKHLGPGGRLVLDVFNPSLQALIDGPSEGEFGEEPEFRLGDGSRAYRRFRTHSRDLHQQITDVEIVNYVIHPDGKKQRFSDRFKMRYLFRYELEHLLARCGFKLEHLYADYERNPFGSKDPGELIAVAGKV